VAISFGWPNNHLERDTRAVMKAAGVKAAVTWPINPGDEPMLRWSATDLGLVRLNVASDGIEAVFTQWRAVGYVGLTVRLTDFDPTATLRLPKVGLELSVGKATSEQRPDFVRAVLRYTTEAAPQTRPAEQG
jgi:hypothetical protein